LSVLNAKSAEISAFWLSCDSVNGQLPQPMRKTAYESFLKAIKLPKSLGIGLLEQSFEQLSHLRRIARDSKTTLFHHG
jgi:hypothetical protein